ncbi:MAG: hypothetical protein RL148_247 [Planctomycetota bacterium]|jgi:hypothetical protein
MSSCIETREVLSKLEGVLRVHPFGLNGKCTVMVSDKKAFTEKKVEEALKATKELRLRKMEKVSG